jgi:hypothetical protein
MLGGNKKLKLLPKEQRLKLIPGVSDARKRSSEDLTASILLPLIEPEHSTTKTISGV